MSAVPDSRLFTASTGEPLPLSPEDVLLFRIHITSSDDAYLEHQCDIHTLTRLQTEVSNIIKERIRDDVFIRTTFHKGSLIILITISAAVLVVINTSSFRYLQADIENVISKIFVKVSNVTVNIDFKTVKKTLDLLGDVLSIVAKLWTIFGGSSLSPFPSDVGQRGWSPVPRC
jgi:hypothetical protein